MQDFETVEDVLKFAISLEQASQRFYEQLSGQVLDPSVVEFLQDMATQEMYHEQQLREMLENGQYLVIAPIPEKEIKAYVNAMKVPDEMDYKRAVKVARDKENASRMLYSILSGLAEDPLLRKLFMRLADEELKHKKFFDQEYERICLGEN